MLKNMPERKRYLFTDSLNRNPDIRKKNDKLQDYNDEIQQEIKGSLIKALDGAAKGAIASATVGNLIPVVAPAVLGFLGGLMEEC